MPSENKFVTLSDNCTLRNLETPCVYNKSTDELYELDTDAFGFLRNCDGTKRLKELGGEPAFLDFCFKEGILYSLNSPLRRRFCLEKSPAHSLRYLELHLTGRCNLRCAHCYLSAGDGQDLELVNVFRALDEFDVMQGLRLLISGGEPLMHRKFWYINEKLHDYGFRSVLLSNGSLITRDVSKKLKVNEAQISIDGMEGSHDRLRGHGSFAKAVKAVEHLQSEGIKVSVSTTVNALNCGDFNEMNELFDAMGITEWNVDMPSVTGRFGENTAYALPPDKAAPFISYGFGGGHHGGSEGFACGSHLCVVGSGGQVAKCGFYLQNPVGNIKDGLKNCWERIKPIRLDELTCDCDFLEICKGGCRFRAQTFTDALGPDPVRCHNLGVDCEILRGGDTHDYNEGDKDRV
jgi:radical SAM protein with 4Fe4S-binding SPASM domain